MMTNKPAAIGSSVIVLGALLIGLYVLGSPMEERFRRLDEQRVADLLQLSRAINRNFRFSDRLPTNLTDIVDGQLIRRLPIDLETEAMYQYEIIDIDSYRLCAEFSIASEEGNLDDFWSHSMGRECFDFKAQSDR